MKFKQSLIAISLLAVLKGFFYTPPCVAAEQNEQVAGSDEGVNQPIPELPGLTDADKKQAFQEVQDDINPITPDRVRALRKSADEVEQAASAPPRFVPKPVTSSLLVDLKPGSTPPVVRISKGYITNVVFVDQMGNPLIVKHVSKPGNQNQIVQVDWIKPDKDNPGQNNFQITPIDTYAMGNISVRVEGVDNVPISVTFVSGQRVYDDRADIRIKGVGFGISGHGMGLPGDADTVLISLLSGVPPDNSVQLDASMSDVEAWKFKDSEGKDCFWIRSKWTLLSPAFLATRQSSDGTHAYKINPTPVLNMSVNGVQTMVTLAGY